MQKCFIFFLIIFIVLALEISAQIDSVPKPVIDSSLQNNGIIKTLPSETIQDSIKSSSKISLDSLKKHFENFEYGEVIKNSNKLLLNASRIPVPDLFEIYRMKGISHFSLSEDEPAKNSFIEILKIDTSYTLDSLKTSPKIVSFFQSVKRNYILKTADKTAEQIIRIDTVFISDPLKVQQIEAHSRTSSFLSLIYPGVGHLYDGQKTKGWILTALTTVSLASSIYFYFDADKKRNSYLKQTLPISIESKYTDYNKSFRYRNISFAALAAIWLYSQLDLLFFSDSASDRNSLMENSTLGITPNNGFKFNLKLNF